MLTESVPTLTPVEGQRAVRFAGQVQIAGILEGIVGGHNLPDHVASPGGLDARDTRQLANSRGSCCFPPRRPLTSA
jgi:hypothetical protein